MIKDSLRKITISDDKNPDQFQKQVIEQVLEKIYKGGSALKKPLQSANISISDVVRSIKHKRCLRTADRDFGATYLEQIIGGAIRDVIPLRQINAARKIFGLDKLPPSELIRHKQKVMSPRQKI